MLVEIPLLASIDSEEQKRKTISKPFRRLLDFADRQVFTGPPESTRDHIMQASKALQDGDWEKCRDLIQSIKIWTLMPEPLRRIQEQGSAHISYVRPTLQQLLIIAALAHELAASLDQAGGVVVFHRIDLTRPQQLAQIIAEKVSAMVDQNEKSLDARMGGNVGLE
ncbi:hypothetical protein DFP72DRAFT_1082993 [Ephemerocybe angulata]|uniref:EIF3CL-like C-terminal domain-containing protein n=1 Tax=Ephemerocybe angulata TaxID=980116 RepID=A0A8H6H8G4_9AGAR|nr:hypothetical protein DFP72DRAFT_1082993 [Tulosesus angulatus]